MLTAEVARNESQQYDYIILSSAGFLSRRRDNRHTKISAADSNRISVEPHLDASSAMRSPDDAESRNLFRRVRRLFYGL